MRVLEIWRYPVKSMQGESLESAEVTPSGLGGDRRFALFDADTGYGLTARRHPELLHAFARGHDDGSATVTLPDGSAAPDDATLSRWLGRPVTLRRGDVPGPRDYENPDDFEDETTGAWHPFRGATGAFHDSEDATVSLLSTGSLGGWDRRRFRANLLLDGSGEDDLIGSRVRIGTAVLAVFEPIPRCVMVTRSQPDGIARDLEVLRSIHRDRGGLLAVAASVIRAGRITRDDELLPVPSTGG